METVIKIGIGFIFAMVLAVTVEAITDKVPYDHNGDGHVNITDVSMAIDNLDNTVEYAKKEVGDGVK